MIHVCVVFQYMNFRIATNSTGVTDDDCKFYRQHTYAANEHMHLNELLW